MGKIRVSALGNEQEEKLKDARRVRRAEKKKRAEATKVHISGMKGGQRVKAVGASEEEIEKMAKITEEVEKDQAEGLVGMGNEDKKEKKAKRTKIRSRGKRYKEALMKVDRSKFYTIGEALELLRTISLAKFDSTVELHINVGEKGIRGTLSLPHGTGKEVRVAVAEATSIDKLIEKVEKGKIDFDALVASPHVMGKLARVAKFLGPRGLMPNPKNGTISAEPEKVAKRLKNGEINWKTETDFPVIHQVIGKLSFKDGQLSENFKAFVKSVGDTKIKSITLKSSMSPGIKVKIS